MIELKRRSGYIAALAALALGVQLILGALTSSGQQPSIEIGPAVGVGHSRSFTPSNDPGANTHGQLPTSQQRAADDGLAPQRRTSGAVGEFTTD